MSALKASCQELSGVGCAAVQSAETQAAAGIQEGRHLVEQAPTYHSLHVCLAGVAHAGGRFVIPG